MNLTSNEYNYLLSLLKGRQRDIQLEYETVSIYKDDYKRDLEYILIDILYSRFDKSKK